MKHSKTEGGIILSLILIFWGLGLFFEENQAAWGLAGTGAALFTLCFYMRFIRDI
jgi:hypothetical protein